ncbi:hypothetical protein E5288_WYG020898 [Bos mutus]|uniref:Phosphatidylcholine transfer protein n=1 Tax=Bos mutus TaxID=72004 RepID=A0A6B0R9A1_9CETA|nr:hypothetical protein [Bos mutus]
MQLVKNSVLKLLTGLHEYKVSGIVRSPPDLLADVYMDLEYRKQWDQYVQEAYETECNGETVTYMKMEFPFLFSSRDCVYVKQRRELDFRGQKIQVVLAKGTSLPQFPKRSGFVRVSQCQVKLAVESAGSNQSKVFIYCFINPGGRIPSWLINKVAKNGIPGFLADLEDACLRSRTLLCFPLKHTAIPAAVTVVTWIELCKSTITS